MYKNYEFNDLRLIKIITRLDFQSRYSGTIGGYLWAVLHPLITTTVFYFVFAIGLRVAGPPGTPFIAWFIGGLVPWFFFNEGVLRGVNAVTSSGHLIKKLKFPIYILPITSVLSTLVVNSFFWVLLGVLLIYLGIEMQISKILFVNYVLAEFIFILAIVYFLSALSVFIKDVKDITAVLTNLLFWSTPIVWDEAVIPDKYRFILDYNPMYYFVKGTRDTLIYNDMRFAHELSQHAIFYGVFIILLFLSFRFYFVMKDEFAQNL